MNKIDIKICLIAMCLFLSHLALAQSKEPIESPPTKLPSDRYLLRTAGLTAPTYRDFATSPLFYAGAGLYVASGWQRNNERIERLFELSAQFAGTVSLAPESDFFPTGSLGIFVSLDLHYHYLFRIPALSTGPWNTKLGGAIQMTQNLRVNQSLSNAAAGLESMHNLMVSGKVSRDISRKNSVERNYIFFTRTLPPQRRDVSFQLNIGVLNVNNRPGYAYVYDSGIDGNLTIGQILDSYERSVNGYRISTRLEFSRYFPNGNGRKWAYLWDIAHLPGKHEAFQMFSHRIAYTILIHNNKR